MGGRIGPLWRWQGAFSKKKRLLNEYWGEVVAIVVYLVNRSPTKVVRDRIPQEACFRCKWMVEYLRVFRCVEYAHVPKENMQKLDDKGEK